LEEVLTMEKGRSKQIVITADTETGKILSVKDENGTPATIVGEDEIQKAYESPNGFKYIGTMLFTHSSPGCVWVVIGGRYYRICY
jgi:hypothetical protein